MKEHSIFSSDVSPRDTTGVDVETYQMPCQPMKCGGGWLFTINANNESVGTRTNIIKSVLNNIDHDIDKIRAERLNQTPTLFD